MSLFRFVTAFLLVATAATAAPAQWQTYSGEKGPGVGKHVVLISGDEEYRSEEALPQLAKILAKRHGFECTVLFAQDPAVPGIINPDYLKNIPGLEALADADLMIIATRFRDLPDEQMQMIDDYLKSGRPVMGLRTATHAFNIPAESKWAHYSFNYQGEKSEWQGGFGEAILGTSWVAHHGWHKKESARGIITDAHPINSGIESGSIWSAADVYTVKELGPEAVPVVWGQVLTGMDPEDEPIGPGPYDYTPRFAKDDPDFDKNDPMQPIAWTQSYQIPGGKKGKVFASTLGASVDLANASTRRLLVQGAYWTLDLDIPAEGVNADLVGRYEPTMFINRNDPTYWPERNEPVAESTTPKLPPGVITPIDPESVPFQRTNAPNQLAVNHHDRIAIIGSGLGSRMNHFGHFETELFLRFADKKLTIRNFADEGNTPAFRPHSARNKDEQYAFPGGKELLPREFQVDSRPQGHFETPDQWLTRFGADTVVAFFGFNSSFGGPSDVDRFRRELQAFIRHTLSQKYNGKTVPQLALISPTAFQDLSAKYRTPDGIEENANLLLYTNAMRQVAKQNGVLFVDLFQP